MTVRRGKCARGVTARAVVVSLAAVIGVGAVPATAWAQGDGPAEYPSEMPGKPKPFKGEDSGCTVPDPTGTGGCVTEATAWMLGRVEKGFGDLPVSCWDEHARNPSSDHPRGRACDYTFGRIGEFPGDDEVDDGWLLATWLKKNSKRLHVSYVIWQGQIWVRGDDDWREYTGGGVYDPEDPTGGHYDHVHVSLKD